MEALLVFSLQAGLIVVIWGFVALVGILGYQLYRGFWDL